MFNSLRPHNCSPPGSSVHGILQATILEWLPLPTPGALPNPGVKPVSLASPILASGFITIAPTGKPFPFPTSTERTEFHHQFLERNSELLKSPSLCRFENVCLLP